MSDTKPETQTCARCGQSMPTDASAAFGYEPECQDCLFASRATEIVRHEQIVEESLRMARMRGGRRRVARRSA